MNFTNKFKQTMSLFLTFTFILNTTLSASVAINAEQRPVDMGKVLRNSDRPSDMPVASYGEFFEKESINLVENIDISEYIGMKGFIGYGVYDIKEDQCQYLEVPGKGKFEFDQDFEAYGSHNGHTYGLSRNTMDYNSCVALAGAFGGSPVAIDNNAENYYLDGRFSNASFGEPWVGATINSCSDESYTSGILKTQFYTNWASLAIKSDCSESRKSVKMNLRGKWEKVNSSNFNKCLVEWTSDTRYRPIRVCAPWWKIHRDYKNEKMGLYSEKELNRINQSDLPTTLNICTKYDPAAAAAAEAPRRDVTCTSYYSRTIAPECARDMKQDQCYVDECQGYLKMVCRHKDEEIAGKGYIKGQVIKGGSKVSVKMKDEVKTHVYDCPPSPPSQKQCTEKSQVMIWPKECPGSACFSLKECYLGAEDDAAMDSCQASFTCEKIYASRDIPPKLDAGGNLIELYGTCSDGSQLSFLPNILDKNNRSCLEYETYTVTEEIHQKCVVEKPVNNYHVNVAFTDEDIYQDDPNCLRTDKIENSQKLSEITVDILNSGYFRHKISKVHLDETVDLVYNGGNDNLLIAGALSAPDTGATAPSFENSPCEIDFQCGILDEETENMAFLGRTHDVLFDGNNKNNDIENLNLNSHELKVFGLSENKCLGTAFVDSYAKDKGFENYVTNTRSDLNAVTGNRTCVMDISSTATDSLLDQVKTLDGNQLVYTFTGTMTKDLCLRKAICIDGVYNENNFGADYSSTGQCIVISGEAPDSYMDYAEAEAGCVATPIVPVESNACTPPSSSGSGFTSINGFESILIFEDFLSGPWAYYSNFTEKLPKQNKVTLTTTNYSDQAVYPLIKISTIKDYERYVEEIYHEAWLAKNPDYQAGAAAAVAGAALTYAASYVAVLAALGSTGIGLAVVVIIIIVLMVMNQPKKMNRQDTEWVIFKHIEPDRYHSLFEKRTYVTGTNKQVGSHDPSFFNIEADNGNWIYFGDATYTGRVKPGEFKKKLKVNFNRKKIFFTCGGWNDVNLDIATHGSERGIITGYPSKDPWNPWKTKKDTYNWNLDRIISKDVNTIYYGADQSMTILLPYRGAFIFEAYDKYNNLLSKVDISEDSFINAFSTDSLKFAQVKFGPGMQLAENISQNACASDPMVEWGGGVSGAYHENKTTGLSDNCEKANDVYVEDHAMTKIKIIPTNMENEAFEYTLTRPLPFANRIYAATLDKLQDRFYRCYGDFPECSDSQYSEEE